MGINDRENRRINFYIKLFIYIKIFDYLTSFYLICTLIIVINNDLTKKILIPRLNPIIQGDLDGQNFKPNRQFPVKELKINKKNLC